jgi:hypothetical protein
MAQSWHKTKHTVFFEHNSSGAGEITPVSIVHISRYMDRTWADAITINAKESHWYKPPCLISIQQA